MLQKPRPWARPIDKMDIWLESQNFYRKHTARDGSCLFRAVAEQLFFTQVYHCDVRRATVEYLLRNPSRFQPMVDEPIDIYAERMRSSKEYGGRVEIEAISIMYQHDVQMYDEIGKEPEDYTCHGFPSKITLCHSLDRHYDSVFTKNFINKAAFCQSVVYEMLYKNVFELKEVDYAVSKMLHDKINKQPRDPLPFIDCFSIRYEMRDNYTNVRDLLEVGITPFPYKVAKSLDPETYRNVEYDTWNDYRKGLRYGFCTWNCRELQVGVKCAVKVNENVTHIGHIQEMAPNKGPVVVYIEKIGEMMTVPYKSLEMLPSPPVILPPARPSPALNLKYASLLSTMALRRTVPAADDAVMRLRRPTKLNLAPRNRMKVRNESKSAKPPEPRREQAQVPESQLTTRSDYNPDTLSDEEDSQSQQEFSHHGIVAINETSVMTEREETVSQIYMPIEGSRNVYILNAQPDPASHAVALQDNRPALVPITTVPLHVNLMAQKSVNMDGSDLPNSDVSTLRFCYNLGVDCLRMNCLSWNLRPNSSVLVNPAAIVTPHPHPAYMAIENQPIPPENLPMSAHSMGEAMGSHQIPTPLMADPARLDHQSDGKCRYYEGPPLVQHPEITSTTPSTPTTPLSSGPFYYPIDFDQPLCLPTPYMEYVYEVGTPTTVYPYPVSYVSQDGIIYHPLVAHHPPAQLPSNVVPHQP